MKKIRVVCNSKDTPVKFPADVKYFFAKEEDRVGEKTAQRIISTWGAKNNIVVLDMMITPADSAAITPDMQDVMKL